MQTGKSHYQGMDLGLYIARLRYSREWPVWQLAVPGKKGPNWPSFDKRNRKQEYGKNKECETGTIPICFGFFKSLPIQKQQIRINHNVFSKKTSEGKYLVGRFLKSMYIFEDHTIQHIFYKLKSYVDTRHRPGHSLGRKK